MSLVIYSPEAEADLATIVDFIAHDKPEAARNWIRKLRESCKLLSSQPEMGEVRTDIGIQGCRSFSVGSYVIYFRRTPDGIQVARIVHGSRDILNW